MNNLNELTNVSRSGTLTVAGTATERRGSLLYGSPAGVTNVTVSGTGLTSGSAELYADGSWARTNASPATSGASTYTAIAQDTYGRSDTNSLSVTLSASVACQYDANGNLANDGTRSFEYDAENQLTNVYAAGQWRSSFRYDAFLRLRVKQEYAWQSSAWVLTNEVRYVYDGMEVVQERDGNNTPQVSYTRGNDLSGSLAGAGGIGGLLARTDMGLLAVNDGNASALYHADGNGNITCLIQTNGTVAARYSYDPFGRLLTLNGALADANVYRFSSKEWHANAGLYYYGYRFYSPDLQRWPNQDPIGERGFEVLRRRRSSVLVGEPNRYLFVKNNPINTTDSLGLMDSITLGFLGCVRSGNPPSFCACVLAPDPEECEKKVGGCIDAIGSIPNPGTGKLQKPGVKDICRCVCEAMYQDDDKKREQCEKDCGKKLPKPKCP